MSDLSRRKTGSTYIAQGDFAIDGGPEATITTLLGSCVSACIWDPVREIGGMNHVLFVDDTSASGEAYGYGINSMELLINGLLRLGASKSRLQAKVFGGSRMLGGTSSAGEKNGAFVVDFLGREEIEYLGGDLGGSKARRLEFWPGTGRARMKYVDQDIATTRLKSSEQANDVELF